MIIYTKDCRRFRIRCQVTTTRLNARNSPQNMNLEVTKECDGISLSYLYTMRVAMVQTRGGNL